jgi:hypothetical protein
VVFATMDVDRNVAVLVYEYGHPASPPEELLSLLGPIEMEASPLFPYPRRELSKPPSRAELKTLRALVRNLRLPISEISRSTGLSQKVVKKTRRQLLEQGLFQVQPIFQSARSNRIIMYEVHVHSSDESVPSRTRETFPGLYSSISGSVTP